MHLSWTTRELHSRHAFRISRPRRTALCNVFIRLEKDGLAGYGEAAPSAFYAETWEGIVARLEAAREWLSQLTIESTADIEQAWDQGWRLLGPSRAAQCAVDLALWDWLGRRARRSVSELLWGEPARAVTSFATIGLSTADELEEKLAELTAFPWIKIKSDQLADLTPIRRVREKSAALLAVDANCAWTAAQVPALAAELARLGVSFIEQPLPPDATESLRCELPIFADESCVTEADVERVAREFDGFNIKIVKCGGLTPARRMVQHGRKLHRQIMVGCMLESSALIAAGAAIAQQADFADLDGAWLIADDVFAGWHFDRGIISPAQVPGLGVEPQPGLFD